MTVTEKDLQVNLENQGRIFDTLNDTSIPPLKCQNFKTKHSGICILV